MKRAIKYLKYLIGTIIILLFILVVTTILFPHIDRATQFNVVMIDGQLYFALEKKYKVKEVEVRTVSENFLKPEMTFSEKFPKQMWRILDPIDYYPKMTLKIRQIKYGVNPGKFDMPKSPEKLERNVKYIVTIKSSQGPFSGNRYFIIHDNNRIKMFYDLHDLHPKCSKNRTVIVEKDGRKTEVPYTVEFIKNKEGEIEKKAIVSHPEKGRIIE